jgi:hypothetical protein
VRAACVLLSYRSSTVWEIRVFLSGRGNEAWSFGHAHERQGKAIRNAEAEIDKIGSKGDARSLQQAYNTWVRACREVIEDWKRAFEAGGKRS